jgi:hypothetical protein
MADKKISQLTGASTPLAGTEVLPIVQSGSTVKVTVADLTAGRAVSASTATLSAGSAAAPCITTTGDVNTGIFFPAADTIAFTEGGAESMRIDSSGQVGIGTASPTQKLDVAGGMKGGVINRAATYTAAATTPAVTGASYMEITNASATTITNFTGAVAGQILMMKFNDANTTINRSNAALAGSVNFVSANKATLTLIYDGAGWFEICRSTLNG